MRHELALSRYLSHYAESPLPDCPGTVEQWQHALIIPAYREPADFLDALAIQEWQDTGNILVIVVLNRPDDDPDEQCNEALRNAILTRPNHTASSADAAIYPLGNQMDLFLYDMERSHGPCPAREGVGLARKWGCDIALHWLQRGAINSQWLCSTDADARLPADYFRRLDDLPDTAAAVTFPFHHAPADDATLTTASMLYELRLHHYVLGLEYAGSRYAMHTLGSCMAVRANAYAHVRGVPRRNAAEDFYLLNKLAKIGDVARLPGNCIRLASRASDRVPFGTGPSVAAIEQLAVPLQAKLFYDPGSFHALKAVLRALQDAHESAWDLNSALQTLGLDDALIDNSTSAMATLGLEKALSHCRRQCRTPAQFDRHMHHWFDGFRTLKFIHALRDKGMPLLGLDALGNSEPRLWPADMKGPYSLRERISAAQRHWQWQAEDFFAGQGNLLEHQSEPP